jgi:hypothetical protein
MQRARFGRVARHACTGSAVLAKLGLRDRVAAVIAAYESGVIEVGNAQADRARPRHDARLRHSGSPELVVDAGLVEWRIRNAPGAGRPARAVDGVWRLPSGSMAVRGTNQRRRSWSGLALAAAIGVVLLVAGLAWTSGPRPPGVEYRPAAVDLVTSFENGEGGWVVALESGALVKLTASVRDLLRPVHGAPLSPSVGDLLLTDSLESPTWVAFTSGGGGAPGKECYPIQAEAYVFADRLVFRSGLSVSFGPWRREPLPPPATTLPGACLDRQGKAVERLLGLGFQPPVRVGRAASDEHRVTSHAAGR